MVKVTWKICGQSAPPPTSLRFPFGNSLATGTSRDYSLPLWKVKESIAQSFCVLKSCSQGNYIGHIFVVFYTRFIMGSYFVMIWTEWKYCRYPQNGCFGTAITTIGNTTKASITDTSFYMIYFVLPGSSSIFLLTSQTIS